MKPSGGGLVGVNLPKVSGWVCGGETLPLEDSVRLSLR